MRIRPTVSQALGATEVGFIQLPVTLSSPNRERASGVPGPAGGAGCPRLKAR